MTTLVKLRDASYGDQVIGGRKQHLLEFSFCLVEPAKLRQGAAERHVRGDIEGMLFEACAAKTHGLVIVTGAAMLFRELRKRNRRRILLNPASKFVNPRMARQAAIVAPTEQARP